ncbi:hypothetical protein [Natrinema amylolyticum]|uniref:hypothetical protein n=1 Tax=Natrinema amylolyticum TaxID=2878679 RepID=UPI001CFB63D5|nr:hypothetical protein [Natrinema amylolyticum]
MNGTVIGENEVGIGVDINDNNGVIHEISIEKGSWEIVYHEQEGYPDDPDDRTGEGNEMVDQARDYAKWYVAQNTEYDTVPWYLRSDQIEQVENVVADLSEDDLKHHFHHYYQQLAGAYDATIAQPNPIPCPQVWR